MSLSKSGSCSQPLAAQQPASLQLKPEQKAITPKDVLRLKCPTADFLVPFTPCPPVQFLGFSIKDQRSGEVFFDHRPPGGPGNYVPLEPIQVPEGVDPNVFRTADYTVNKRFLDSHEVSTSLVFGVGSKQLNHFRMIERHYVGSTLIKSYDFDFGYCIPGSVNTWESVYTVPPLDKRVRKEMVTTPRATKVDSFFFADGQLVMHNKAFFTFCDNE